MVKIKNMQKKLSARDFKAELAKEIVSMYHSKKAAKGAEKEFVQVFREKKQPTVVAKVQIKQKQLNLVDLLTAAGLAASKSQARRLIEQGGVRLNGVVQEDSSKSISLQKGMVLQVGKRRFVKIA